MEASTGMIVKAFEGHDVRIDVEGDTTWWVAKDVCELLGLETSSGHLLDSILDDDEKGVRKIPTLGGPQNLRCVTEPGLYTLIMRSNKPEAHAFKRWVTHEVLPELRKTGTYTAPADYIAALRALASSEEKRLQLEAEAERNNPLAKAWQRLASTEGLYSYNEAAKVLYNLNEGTGRTRFMAMLRERNYINRENEPYQRYIESDLFRVRIIEFRRPSGGEMMSRAKPFLTSKGIEHMRALIVPEGTVAQQVVPAPPIIIEDTELDIDALLRD